jgi:IS605 OrfB family transposase
LFDKNINEIEIIPRHHGRWFEVKYSYGGIKEEKSVTPLEVSDPLVVVMNPKEKKRKIAEENKKQKKEATRLQKIAERTQYTINNYASIDLGVVNLAAVYIPSKDVRPLIISGRELIVANNNARAVLAKLSKKHKKYTAKHYKVLRERENRIDNFLHTASSRVIDHLKESGVKKLVIGYNTNWKTGVNLGKKNNDTFYKIPFRNFISQLFYKGQDSGIDVVESNESYTSKCDALNNEPVGFHESYSGKREKRGLFRSAVGAVINADINGAINILRKYVATIGTIVVQKLVDVVAQTHQLLKSPFKSGIINKTDTNTSTQRSYVARCAVMGGRDYPNRVLITT